jgi:hypothetical protein
VPASITPSLTSPPGETALYWNSGIEISLRV